MTEKNFTTLPERNLDVLRAIAVLCVVVDHLTWPFTNGALYPLGLFGVYLFFVHTSLVLMASLERTAVSVSSPLRLIWSFYLRRAFRIYPLAWAALTLVILLHIPLTVKTIPPSVVDAFEPPTRAELVTNFALVQNVPPWVHRSILGVLWSLPVEVQMYVLLPALWWVARRKEGVTLIAMIIPLVALTGIAYHANLFRGVPVLWRLPSVVYFAPCFLGGVLAYALLRRRRRELKPPLPAAAWFAVLFVTSGIFAWKYPRDGTNTEWHGWFACIALGTMIPFVRNLSASLGTRVAQQIAKYSYGVYLLHVPAQWVGMVVLGEWSWFARWATTAVLLIVLPVIAYHTIEEPAIRYGSRVAGQKGRDGRGDPTETAGTAPAP